MAPTFAALLLAAALAAALVVAVAPAPSVAELTPAKPLTGCPAVKMVWQSTWTQINQSSFPGNTGGLEDGIVVRRQDGRLTMVAAEMYDNPHWVAMRIGVYASDDGMQWTKERTLRQSTGKFDGGPHSSTWGPFLLHDPANDTWMLRYVAYRSSPSNSSGWQER